MKKNRRLLLFATLILILMSTACGTSPTGTPTAAPTAFPSETETQITPTVEATLTETPTATATSETATPTATGIAGIVPVELICWFCVQQVPHTMVLIPQDATFEVSASSSGVACNSVEKINDKQIVLCRGPERSGSVSFDLNVCSSGNCSERHIVAVDCGATPVSTVTDTPTTTPTAIVTQTVTLNAPEPTATTSGAAATLTPTVVLTMTVTSTIPVTTPTATPTP